MRIALVLIGGALSLAAPAVTAQTTPTPTTGTTPAPDPASPVTPSPAAPDQAAAGASGTAVVLKPTTGATVYGLAGTPVGTVKEVGAQFVTVTTAKGDVRLPLAGFGAGANGLTIGLTAEQLDAAVAQATAGQRPSAKVATPRRSARRHR